MKNKRVFLAVILLWTAAHAAAQEPAKVDLPITIDARIQLADLLLNPQTLEATGMLSSEGSPRSLDQMIPMGAAVAKTGKQTLLVLQVRAQGGVTMSAPVPRLAPRYCVALPPRLAIGWNTPFLLTTLLAAQTQPVGAARVPIHMDLLCAEADKPDPVDTRGWSILHHPPKKLAERQYYLCKLARGVAWADATIARLAGKVRLKEAAGQMTMEYAGEALDEAGAALLHVADWSRTSRGETRGRLNRTAVVQFALWCLTDNYTEDDLERRINEPRFEALQARVASVRWVVRRLLRESGFKEALFDPFSAEVSYNRGVDQLRSGDPGLAERLFRQAIDRRRDHGAAVFNLGLALARQKKWTEARQAFQDARRLTPADAETSYNLGVVAWHETKWDEAVSAFTAALSLNPNHQRARQWLAASEHKTTPR